MEDGKIGIDYFWEQCKKWVDKFALHEYWWMCEEAGESEISGYAEAMIEYESMTVLVRIDKSLFETEDKSLVDRIAYHKVCETMLCIFQNHLSPEKMEYARHSVLNKIAHALGI